MYLPLGLVFLAAAAARPLGRVDHLEKSLNPRHHRPTQSTDTASTTVWTDLAWAPVTSTTAESSVTLLAVAAISVPSSPSDTVAGTIPEASLPPSSFTSASSTTTASTSTQPSATNPAHHAKLNTAAIIGGVVAAIVLALVAFVTALLRYRHRPAATHTEKATLTSPSLDDVADPFRAGTPIAQRVISSPLPLQPRVHAESFSSISIGMGSPPPPLGSWRPTRASFGSGGLAPPPQTTSRSLGPVLQRA